jgi:hypothetical protein
VRGAPAVVPVVHNWKLSWLLFVLHPSWSYRLHADFEDHAVHEYMALVAEHPEWENTPFESEFASDFGHFTSLADASRQIGHDELMHKIESENLIAEGRFR